MENSEMVTTKHLIRKAIVYIRQSHPNSVISHQESLRLQYALKQRAINLGWCQDDIQIIDSDLGLTATSAQNREGFKELVSQVTSRQVGIILSYDVTRLSRNCSDWYPLLDLCGYTNCLIADHDSLYDPASPNGRLLLGLKGQLSELELHTIRARMTAGLLNKAQRGELALTLPAGLIRDETGKVRKDPNLEVQERIGLVFTMFQKMRSASKVLRFFNKNELRLPRHDRFGDLVWKKPTSAAIVLILKNPAYAGAFVYGRTQAIRRPDGKVTQKKLEIDQWKIIVKDKYPAYISWETYEKVTNQLKENYASYDRNQSRGIPRRGEALLSGMVYCGECGHKMLVKYEQSPRYVCNYLRRQYGVSVCQYIPTQAVDNQVIPAFFAALSPVELDAYQHAIDAQKETLGRIDMAHNHQLQRLRYEAQLAQRQFRRVDPDNRLVAAELERRWEEALRALRQAEENIAQHQRQIEKPMELSHELKDAFRTVGKHLPEVWEQLGREHQKALLRCLIDKIVIHRCKRDTIQLRIVWRGGETTSQKIPIPVGSFAELSGSEEMEQFIIDKSRQGQLDEEIAAQLTALGYRSPQRMTVLPSLVRTIRLRHRIFRAPSQSHPRRIPGYLTVPQIAKVLDVKRHWVYHHINMRRIQVQKDASTGLYLFPDRPRTLEMFQKLKTGYVNNLRFS
ncbi:MAG: recombinase family protein [Candidatus Thorarchaeota archaeon]|jgi:DNA invertase Pin-like site-specific DNA recombinase